MVLVRGADPVSQTLVAREQEIHAPLPRRPRDYRPMRLVHHCDSPTSTADGLVPGALFHFELLKRSRSVVLSGVVGGEFRAEVVEHILRQTR